MKSIFLHLITLILSLFVAVFAQENTSYLEVDYEMEVILDADQVIKNVPASYRAQVEAPLREEIKNGIFVDYKLKTDGKTSVYKMQPKIDNSQSTAGFIVQQITSNDKEPLYKNITEREFIKPYNIMGQEYMVKDALPYYEWTITRETDQIAGFDVRKATGFYYDEPTNDTITITSWFAPKLKFKDGPDRNWGLPGLILKTEGSVKSQNMDFVLLAKTVTVKNEEFKIEKPESNGKILTQDEFSAEMKAMQEKWKEMSGGGVETDE